MVFRKQIGVEKEIDVAEEDVVVRGALGTLRGAIW
jgi:hypothetical protein